MLLSGISAAWGARHVPKVCPGAFGGARASSPLDRPSVWPSSHDPHCPADCPKRKDHYNQEGLLWWGRGAHTMPCRILLRLLLLEHNQPNRGGQLSLSAACPHLQRTLACTLLGKQSSPVLLHNRSCLIILRLLMLLAGSTWMSGNTRESSPFQLP